MIYGVLLLLLALFFRWALRAMRRSSDAEARAAAARFDAAVGDLREAVGRLARSVWHKLPK